MAKFLSCINQVAPDSFLIAAFFLCASFTGCSGTTEVAVPQNYVEYNSPDGVFALDYPEGWKAEGNGNRSRGSAYANITQSPIEIRIEATMGYELKAGVLLAAGGDENSTEGMLLTKQGVIHDHWRPSYIEKYKGYEEEPGVSKKFNNFGPARINEFSGKRGFTKIKGVRATFLLLDRILSFEATCPQSQWEKFKPVFEKMMDSFRRGVEKIR